MLLLLNAPLPAVAAGLEPQPAPLQQSANLLQNPGFEDGFYHWNGINELHLGNGWVPWWIENAEHTPTYFRPEYKQAQAAEFPNRVHSGNSAQQWFKLHSSFYAGIYQQVSGLTPGQPYRFSLWAQVWSSTEDNPPDVSTAPANPHLQIGVDPTGNLDPFSVDIIWSPEAAMNEVIDGWSRLTLNANAKGSTITVFVRSRPEFANKHNSIYLDDASLESAIPTPEVTATAGEGLPALTPAATVVATDTPPELPVATTSAEPVTLQPVNTATATQAATVAAVETEEPPALPTSQPATSPPPLAEATVLQESTTSPSTEMPQPEPIEPVVTNAPSPEPEVTAASSASPSSTATSQVGATNTPQGTEVAAVGASPPAAVATGAPVGDAQEEPFQVNPLCATPLLAVALLVPVLIITRRRRHHGRL